MTEAAKGAGRCLLEHLRASRLTEYGSVIPGDVVREVLDIKVPEIGTREEFTQAALTELNAVDYCRNVLLGEGKYLGSQTGNYRIILPSENADQIKAYMRHAMTKLKRADKLASTAPKGDFPADNAIRARILMTQEGIKTRTLFGEVED